MWRVPFALYFMALAARTLSGLFHPEPAYPDASYYVAVARSLAAGDGFTVDFIWNFVDVGGSLPAQATLPIPSNGHWMPLAAIVQVPFLLILGTSPLATLIPFALAGALSAPLGWLIARDAGLSPFQAVAAGLMTAVPGAVAPFLGQPDNFALFMPLGALALWLCARGLRGDSRAFVLGGVVVGLATLARNDGILLGIPFALGWLSGRPRLPLATAVGCAAGFLVVMAPWYARQLDVFGSLSPSASNGRILWITAYPQLYSVGGDPTPASFLAQGWAALLESRIRGFVAALGVLAVEPFLFFLVPFALWGAWSRRRSPLLGPWFVYGTTLLLVSGLLFAVHVPYGTFLHSAVALVPHGYVLTVEGIALAVAWTARRLRHWDVPRATRTFSAIAVAVLWIGGAIASAKIVDDWKVEAERHRAVAVALASLANPGDRLMSADAGGYRYYTGLGGVVTPEDPLPTVEAVARAYDVRWLVVEPAHIVASLADVYRGALPLPGWLRQVADAPGEFRIYAACLDPADAREACRQAIP